MGDDNKMDKTRVLNRHLPQKDKAKEAKRLSQWLAGRIEWEEEKGYFLFPEVGEFLDVCHCYNLIPGDTHGIKCYFCCSSQAVLVVTMAF